MTRLVRITRRGSGRVHLARLQHVPQVKRAETTSAWTAPGSCRAASASRSAEADQVLDPGKGPIPAKLGTLALLTQALSA
jgi:hypothetical protein